MRGLKRELSVSVVMVDDGSGAASSRKAKRSRNTKREYCILSVVCTKSPHSMHGTLIIRYPPTFILTFMIPITMFLLSTY